MSEFMPRPIAPTDRVLKTNDDAGAAIDQRALFRNSGGTFYAQWWNMSDVGTVGQLPDAWVRRLMSTLDAHGRVYVVYSYATPIAWTVVTEAVVIPNVRYSPTTDRHQWAAANARGARWETLEGAATPPVTHRPAHGHGGAM